MVRETRFQSQIKSYQRLKIFYLVPPCLTLSIITYALKVNGEIQGKESHSHLGVLTIEKGAFVSTTT